MRSPFLSKEFVLEEALHVKVAKAIEAHGYPKIYYSEQAKEAIFLDRTPALFIPIAIAVKLSGSTETAIRTTLMLFSLAEIATVMLLLNRIFPKNFALALITGLLMASSPYLIQTNLQIHFESAIFTFFITFFMLFSLLKIKSAQNSISDHLQLSLIFFVAFAIKYETSLMALATVSVFAFIYFRKFLKKLFAFSSFAIILSQLLLLSYNLYFGNPQLTFLPAQSIFWVFQNVIFPKLTSTAADPKIISLWANNYYLLIRFLSWISIPAIILFIASAAQIAKSKKLIQDPKIVFLLIWFFLFSGIYLIAGWAGDFPRYFATAMPAFFTLISIAAVNQILSSKQILSLLQISILFFASGIVLFVLQKNNLLFLDHITGWIPQLQAPFLTLTAFLVIITLILTLKTRFSKDLLILLSMVYFGQILFQFNHDLNSDYSLTNFFGASHFKDAGLFLKSNLNPNDVILTIDPVAYYWDGKFYDYYFFGTRQKDYRQIYSALERGTIKAIALPKSTMADLAQTSKEHNTNMDQLTRKFKNHIDFGSKNGIEIYF